ncbi:hypothetical protein WMY93_006942 [Mugilogobius chulae]|uniref:Thermogenin n=1 Tax=Mugilogobius chulae TaxID=88201 RepID=A0AAW0PLQ6_9GOBI
MQTCVLGEMVGLKPSDVPPPLGVKMASAGAAACIADLVTFPLDTAKVRLQIQGEKKSVQNIRYRGVFGTIATMVRTEGPRSLYNGLVAGLQRQVCFASVRIGLYDNVRDFYTGGKESPGVLVRILAGCTTGAMAVSFAQPTDVVKVRFQAQMNLDGVARRYSGTMQAYKHIFQNEGLKGLWKVDVVKTRYMNSPPGQYKSAINCAWVMLTKEGPTAFYKGFVPSFLRLGSWNIVMFVSFEQIKRLMMVTKKRWRLPAKS